MTQLDEELRSALRGLYDIDRELGGGGMSRVFLAHEVALSRTVVLKVLAPALGEGVSLDRFKREIKVAATLQHPHIVPVLSAGEASLRPYYTMPFVEGESLRSHMERGERPSIADAVNILWDIAKALSYAHAHGVVHRDIKPENILLNGKSAMIADFGIAKALDAARSGTAEARLTGEGTSLGTPAYMAPEQIAADADIDHRADIYAFGCVAYELLAGRPPFAHNSTHALFRAHLVEQPQNIATVAPNAPRALSALVMRCLAKDVADRPQNAADIVRFFEENGATAPGAVFAWHDRGRRNVAIAFVAAVLVMAGILRALTSRSDIPDWALPGTIPLVVAVVPPIFLLGRRNGQRIGVTALGAYVVMIGLLMALRAYAVGPFATLLGAGTLRAGERLLVADFIIGTGDTAVSRVLSEAVRANLSQSTAVTVVPISTVANVLRLARKPTDAPLDDRLVREVAEREGVKAIVSGDLTPLGKSFVLTLRLDRADTKDLLLSFHKTVDQPNEFIGAIDNLTKQMRGAIGESLRLVRSSPPLEQVTTPSLEALRAYTRGTYALDVEVDYARAIGFLQQAISADSGFGMAWRKLAAAYNNGGYPLPLRRQAARKAYSLCERLTERECLHAEAYYMSLEGDRAAAGLAYEKILRLDSLDIGALINLGLTQYQRREFASAETLWKRAVTVRNAPPIAYDNVKWALLNQGKLREADSVALVVRAKFPTRPSDADGAYAQFMRGQFDSAAAGFERQRARAPDALRARAIEALAGLAQLRGSLHQAARLHIEARKLDSARGVPANWMDDTLEMAKIDLFSRRDVRAAESKLDLVAARDPEPRLYLDLAVLYAQAGRAQRARTMLSKHDSMTTDSAVVKRERRQHEVIVGETALANGNPDSALLHFKNSDRYEDGFSDACAICTYERLARAFDRRHLSDSVVVYLNLYLTTPYGQRNEHDPLFLPDVYVRLGELLESRGRTAEALDYYDRFVKLWQRSDSDLQPRVAEIRQRINRLRR